MTVRSVIVVTPPIQIVSLAEAKRHLDIDEDDTTRDQMLDLVLRAAQAEIEPPSWVGRSFGLQTLEVRLDETSWSSSCQTGWGWTGEIPLPYPPLALDPDDGSPLVESVKYLDENNVEQTLATDVWRVLGAGSTGVPKIALAYNQSWPSTLCDPEAIRVRFTAGYAADDPQLLPAKQAILLAVGLMNSTAREDPLLVRENVPGVGTQEWALSSGASSFIRATVDRLLVKYWMPSLG